MKLVIKRGDSYVLLFIILLFQSGLRVLTKNNLIDDICTVLMLLCILLNYRYASNIISLYRNVSLALIIFFFLGIISNIRLQLQDYRAVFMDIYICFRFYIAFIAGCLLAIKSKCAQLRFKSASKLIILILFVVTFINMFFINVFPTYSIRIIPCQQLFFENPAEFASFVIICMIMLIYSNQSVNENIIIYLIFGTLMVFSTVRLKSIGAVVLIWIVYVFFIKKITKSKILFYIISLISVFCVGRDTFEYYYLNIKQPRALLISKAINIAKDYFPFGTGFGTFGSYASRVFYSRLYSKYGLSTVYGLSKDAGAYITDQMWATVLAQFGVVGFVICVVFFVFMFKNIKKYCSTNIYSYGCCIYLLLYELLLTLAESALFNPSALTIFFAMGYVMYSSYLNNKSSLIRGRKICQ